MSEPGTGEMEGFKLAGKPISPEKIEALQKFSDALLHYTELNKIDGNSRLCLMGLATDSRELHQKYAVHPDRNFYPQLTLDDKRIRLDSPSFPKMQFFPTFRKTSENPQTGKMKLVKFDPAQLSPILVYLEYLNEGETIETKVASWGKPVKTEKGSGLSSQSPNKDEGASYIDESTIHTVYFTSDKFPGLQCALRKDADEKWVAVFLVKPEEETPSSPSSN